MDDDLLSRAAVRCERESARERTREDSNNNNRSKQKDEAAIVSTDVIIRMPAAASYVLYFYSDLFLFFASRACSVCTVRVTVKNWPFPPKSNQLIGRSS